MDQLKLQIIHQITICDNEKVLSTINAMLNPLRFFAIQTNLEEKEEKELVKNLNQALREEKIDIIFGKTGIFKFLLLDEAKKGKKEIENENEQNQKIIFYINSKSNEQRINLDKNFCQ
jgi:hypothetical protein